MLIQANTHLANEMSTQQEKAWLHFLSGDPMFRDFVRQQSIHGVDPYGQIARQPMCPKCERPGFHHQKGIACNHCGYTGPESIKAKTYLQEGWWR